MAHMNKGKCIDIKNMLISCTNLEGNEVGKYTSSPCVYKHTHTQIHAFMLQHLNTNTTFYKCDEVLCAWY